MGSPMSWEDGLREIEQFDWSKDSDSANQAENNTQASGEANLPIVGVVPNTPGKPPVLPPISAPKKVKDNVADSDMDWELTQDVSPRAQRKPIARQLFPSASSSLNTLASGLGFPSNDFPTISFESKMSAPSRTPATPDTSKGKDGESSTDKGKGKARAADSVEKHQYAGPLARGMKKASRVQPDVVMADASEDSEGSDDKETIVVTR